MLQSPSKDGSGTAEKGKRVPRRPRKSVYKGVYWHYRSATFNVYISTNSSWKEGQTQRKWQQVYLEGYAEEEEAARAYDLAALKFRGPSTTLNFSLDTYEAELEEMKSMSPQDSVALLKRKNSCFAKGASKYRGVSRQPGHERHGKWQARISCPIVARRYLYLGAFSTEEEAAEAYDIAAVIIRGVKAVTNFDISCYDAARNQQAAVLDGHYRSELVEQKEEYK